MTKQTKKSAAKAPTTVAKKAATKKIAVKKPAPKKLTPTEQTARTKADKAAIAATSLVHKPTAEQRKQAHVERRVKTLRKKGVLPPPNPKTGQLVGKVKAPTKTAVKKAAEVQAEIAPKKTVNKQVVPKPAEARPALAGAAPKSVPMPNFLPSAPKDNPYVGVNNHRQTCIVISRGARVRYIPFATNGLYILTMDARSLDDDYKPTDYPVARAARLYWDAARFIECAENARAALAQLAGVDSPAIKPIPVPNDVEITKEMHMTKNTTVTKNPTQAIADSKKPGPVAELAKEKTGKKGVANNTAPAEAAEPANKATAKKTTEEPKGERASKYDGKKIKALKKPTEHGASEGSERAVRRTAVMKCKTTEEALKVKGVDASVLNNMVKLGLIEIV